ncbi:CocE/NonD family hydrolase [Mesorhizobium sp. M0510]|uniref:CocE/NonD family hydrolase n=1 Tax=Mesorhizobium sp. M0510 TaxID=2956954 RepID=UPI0033394564
MHPYFAGHGYAGVRVDMRGTGDSGGVCKGEYLKHSRTTASRYRMAGEAALVFRPG